MKVAFISPFVCRLNRGIERFTLELAKKLAEGWQDCQLSVLTWPGAKSAYVKQTYGSSGIHILQVPYSRYFQAKVAVPSYFFHLLRHNFDIINIFFACYGEAEALMLAGLLRKQRFNIVFQYPYSQVPHRYKEFTKFKLIDKADNIISVSELVADGVEEFCGKKSIIIHNGFDEQKFSPDSQTRKKIRDELGLPGGGKLILTVSALEERKGIQKIIDIMPLLIRQMPGVTYLVLGEGPYRQELKQRIQRLGLQNNVLMLGAKNDPVPYYRAADLFVLLSYGEAFGCAVIEAMGCGLPVVIPQQRPFAEIFNRDVATIVNENNPQEILQAICALLSDNDKRQRLGETAREFAVCHYSWEKIAVRYYEVLQKQCSIA